MARVSCLGAQWGRAIQSAESEASAGTDRVRPDGCRRSLNGDHAAAPHERKACMNQISDNGVASFIPCLHITFSAAFEVCWAGRHPLRTGLCFGSTDGKILFADEEGTPLAPPGKGSASGEAVNGVAAVGTW